MPYRPQLPTALLERRHDPEAIPGSPIREIPVTAVTEVTGREANPGEAGADNENKSLGLAFKAEVLNTRLFRLARYSDKDKSARARTHRLTDDPCAPHRRRRIRRWQGRAGEPSTCEVPSPKELGSCKTCGERVIGWVCQECGESDQRVLESVHEIGGKVLCIGCEGDRRSESNE